MQHMFVVIIIFCCCFFSIQGSIILPKNLNISDKQVDKLSGWGMLKINPNAFMSIIYQNFKISIYKRDSNESNEAQYYYSPALTFDPESPVYAYNVFTKKHEITFKVLMWDDSYEDFICEAISKKLGKIVSRNDILTLPIEEIRMDASGHSAEYEMVNKWTSYASQPSSFDFRMICKTVETCKEITETMKTNPKHILSDLVVYYSLQSQKSIRRLLSIKAEHIQSSTLFTVLNQMFINRDVVYLQADDAKRLSLEIASNVMAMEVVDDEFVSQDQQVTIANLLDNILKSKTVSTKIFETQMWESVFWQNENSRPDKTTKILNDFFNKSDNKLKELIKTEMHKIQSGSGNIDVGIPFLEGLVNADAGGSINLDTLNKEEKEKIVEALNEFKNVSEWNGEKFTPKSLSLSRINLAALRTNSQITTMQVRVTKTSSELTTRINIINDTRILENLRKVTEIETFMNRECKKHTEAIQNDTFLIRVHILELEKKQEQLIPIGFTYVQFPQQSPPKEIWKTFEWEDVTSLYAGVFFRAEGSSAAPFGTVQSENAPRITHITKCSGVRDTSAQLDFTTISGWSASINTGGNDDWRSCLKFHVRSGELRPINMAIRIWKRI